MSSTLTTGSLSNHTRQLVNDFIESGMYNAREQYAIRMLLKTYVGYAFFGPAPVSKKYDDVSALKVVTSDHEFMGHPYHPYPMFPLLAEYLKCSVESAKLWWHKVRKALEPIILVHTQKVNVPYFGWTWVWVFCVMDKDTEHHAEYRIRKAARAVVRVAGEAENWGNVIVAALPANHPYVLQAAGWNGAQQKEFDLVVERLMLPEGRDI